MTHAQAIEIVAQELLKDVELEKERVEKLGNSGTLNPGIVANAVIFPNVIESLILRHSPNKGPDISGPITLEEVKQLSFVLNKIESLSEELHIKILSSKMGESYRALLSAMIKPGPRPLVPYKKQKFFASKIAAFFGFGE
jgi:hypothetical protein